MELLRNDYINVVELKEQHYFSLATTPAKPVRTKQVDFPVPGGACIHQGLRGNTP